MKFSPLVTLFAILGSNAGGLIPPSPEVSSPSQRDVVDRDYVSITRASPQERDPLKLLQSMEVEMQLLIKENRKLMEDKEKLMLVVDDLKREKEEDFIEISSLGKNDDKGEGEGDAEGFDGVEVSRSNSERGEGRKLVATVSSDKSILQGIAPSVGSKAGTPAWTSTGDPCNDAWRGITCDAGGYVTRINIPSTTLSGKTLSLPTHMFLIIHISHILQT
jgi:hypothetical protein